jgi:hypothetical protein
VTSPADELLQQTLERVATNGIVPEGGAALLDVGTQPFIRFFQEEVLDSLISPGHATCKVIRGAYGSGKSHIADLLRGRALQSNYLVVRTDLSQEVSFDDVQTLARHIVENLECRSGSGLLKGLPAILNDVAASGPPPVDITMRQQLPHTGYARAMSLLVNRRFKTVDDREMLERFLLGDRIPATEFASRQMRGVKNPLNARNAESILRTVARVTRSLGFRGIVLLFDENERTFEFRGHRPPARVVRAANFFRRWIDACATGKVTGTVAVFTVLPRFIENCTLAYPALGQRLEAPRGGTGDWRWPLLDVEQVAPGFTDTQFVEALAARMTELVGVKAPKLKTKSLTALGLKVLEKHAGGEYRRFVARQMALSTLSEMES